MLTNRKTQEVEQSIFLLFVLSFFFLFDKNGREGLYKLLQMEPRKQGFPDIHMPQNRMLVIFQHQDDNIEHNSIVRLTIWTGQKTHFQCKPVRELYGTILTEFRFNSVQFKERIYQPWREPISARPTLSIRSFPKVAFSSTAVYHSLMVLCGTFSVTENAESLTLAQGCHIKYRKCDFGPRISYKVQKV